MGTFNRGYAQKLHGLWLQVGITLCSAWAFTLFGKCPTERRSLPDGMGGLYLRCRIGYDQGVLGGLIALPTFLSDNSIKPSAADLQGTIVAIYDIGCLTGCIFCGFVGQKLGRRLFIVIGGVLLVIGAGLQAGSESSAYLIGGRVIGGVGMGLNTTMVPIWVAETSRAGSRGALICTQLTIVILGVTIAYWFDYGMSQNHVVEL